MTKAQVPTDLLEAGRAALKDGEWSEARNLFEKAPLIGVDPSHQRRGIGGALLRHALERVDEERCLAYLESSNPENIPLYGRHGFEVTGTIQVGYAPPITPMIRHPQ